VLRAGQKYKLGSAADRPLGFVDPDRPPHFSALGLHGCRSNYNGPGQQLPWGYRVESTTDWRLATAAEPLGTLQCSGICKTGLPQIPLDYGRRLHGPQASPNFISEFLFLNS
jgi:hypothetical protein